MVDGSDSSLRKYLGALSGVDQVGADARAAMLATRSIKTSSKRWAIDTAISMVDLTTLEGADTPGKVQALCTKAVRPDPTNSSVPSVGAVCVYNDMVAVARKHLDLVGGAHVGLAAVSTAFPSGRASMPVKIQDTQDALDAGASEIDMVIDRGAFLSGNYIDVFNEIVQIRELCGTKAHLKVIFETGELTTYDNVRKASFLAMAAGADFIKTSTGKIAPAATPPVVLVMLEAVRDFYQMTQTRIGVKPAGGIRNTKDAIKQLVLVNETAGPEWLTPSLFRIGASALLNDLLMQRMKMDDGYYASPAYVTID
ncbi:MAG: deoxyribose-phosphate aldolase [Actinobacteria bacterium]|nr:deoxyribose-phosphate aldolase [Actinomycetota bacterium]MSW62735.1 deoxyribose-phosphate aldolase [Actinomycetota bacterium]MSX89823.1 deoxyribose-phosphate aldolase [Actinomycetota bacterium]MSZ63795.1 deoxyribose-phosphate aldolase [Actinomycetota bacterium]MTA57434.1 deoxyribose-phosphate aldolase [Actinomycetota bacterium]